jgi:hypothetical protein
MESSKSDVAAFGVGAQASTLTFLSPGTTDVTATFGTHQAIVQLVVHP